MQVAKGVSLMLVALMALSTYKTSNELTLSQPVTCGLTLPGKVDMRRCIVRINGGISRAVLYILDIDASVSLIQIATALRYGCVSSMR